jgi:AcrR family transcriptional regulator
MATGDRSTDQQRPRTRRAQQIVDTARRLIEEGDGDVLTMRHLADALGIQAPSLYKHFPDKDAITRALHADYLTGQLAALEAALATEDGRHPLLRVAATYRRYAMDHRQLFRFLFLLPYPAREIPDVLKGLRVVWLKAAGDSDLAVSAYAMVRGMAELEAHELFPLARVPDDDENIGLLALVDCAESLAVARAAQAGSMP